MKYDMEVIMGIDVETGKNTYMAYSENTPFGYIEGEGDSLSDAIADFDKNLENAKKTKKTA